MTTNPNTSQLPAPNPSQLPAAFPSPGRWKIFRSILGVLVGMVVAFTLVLSIEAAGHAIYPPPPGLNVKDPEQLRTIIDKLPFGALVAVLAAWACGTFGGGFVAALIAGRAHQTHAYIVGGLQLAAAVATMLVIPHPLWFAVAAIAIFLVFSGLAGAAAAAIGSCFAHPNDPRRYDMRDKNMAC